jgi:hypothetical protein
MSLTTNDIKHEYMNEESINEHLKCQICTKPFVDPVSTTCESKSHTFCRDCIERWIRTHHSCPTCSQKLDIEDLTPIRTDNFIDMLNEILVKCLDCNQTGLKRSDFAAHYNENCPKAKVKCPSSDTMCTWTGTRDQLEEHLETCAINIIQPLMIAYQNKAQQSQDEINHERTQKESFMNQNKKLKDRLNKHQIPVLGPLKTDKLLSGAVNFRQPLVAGSIKADKQLSTKTTLQQFEPVLNKLNQNQIKTELITTKNKQLQIQNIELQFKNSQLKDQLEQQLKKQTEKSQSKRMYLNLRK